MKKLILLSILLIIGCDNSTEPEIEEENTFDVDWVLIRQPNMALYDVHPGNGSIEIRQIDTGYVFLYVDHQQIVDEYPLFDIIEAPLTTDDVIYNITITGLPAVPPCEQDWSSQQLKVKYNGTTYEEFIYDISDSITQLGFTVFGNQLCSGATNIKFNMFKMFNYYRIKIDNESDLIYLYDAEGEALIMAMDDPNEVIDYRIP